MTRKKIILSTLILPSVMAFAQQYGGMWIPTELNEKEMKQLGMKISAKDIYNTEKPSIKDAVVQFDGGCTAEVISPKGLILTNHHCGYDNIQYHSSVENDLLTNGFWAKNNGEELPNPGVTVDFIADIKEITNQILSGTNGLTGSALEQKIAENINTYKKSQKIESYQRVEVKSMYYGNKFYAYIIDTFKDVRLVGAPPQSIGKFGSDTDNWVWPRHTGDFALFRIYADKNNRPAEYSKDNIPFTPKYYLPISLKDKKEGDFTFVFGFPGRTTEYLPAIAVEKIMNETDPAMISVRDATLKILDEKMRADDATRIKYASKYARVANAWKKWIGEVEGLKKSKAVDKKKSYEQFLISKNPAVKQTVSKLEELYNQQAPYALNRAYYTETIRNAETLTLANMFSIYLDRASANNQKLDTNYLNALKEELKAFYKNYDGELDAKVTAKLLSIYANKTPEHFLPKGFESFKNELETYQKVENWSKNSIITGRKSINGNSVYHNLDELFNNQDTLLEELRKDPLVQVLSTMKTSFSDKVNPKYTELQTQINDWQKTFMAQQLATDKDRKFFPDANSTLRVTYGQVKGSSPKDAVSYHYQTHLTGVMEKYIPKDYEFDVPQKLIQLYNSKDYGIYKDKTGEVPVNFTATNHTTGGNSGSPALDAYGNLVGLNFDRQWEGTMSDINYDPKFSRNIMVDTKYILFIIDKYADSKWLLNEMKIIK